MLTTEEIRNRIAGHPSWYHKIELAPGVVTPGINESSKALELLHLPEDCRGLRALDIGAMDGFFTFALEQRGAQVLAIDNIPPHASGFGIAAEILGSRAEHIVMNLYDLDPMAHGMFDIVLFLGVLYHLRNPLLALDTVRSVCRGKLWLESQVIDHAYVMTDGTWQTLAGIAPTVAQHPLMQFYPTNELGEDYSNWWAPNMACLKAMLASSDFIVDRELLNGARGIFECHAASNPEAAFYRRAEQSTLTNDQELDKYFALLRQLRSQK